MLVNNEQLATWAGRRPLPLLYETQASSGTKPDFDSKGIENELCEKLSTAHYGEREWAEEAAATLNALPRSNQ